MSHRIQDPSPGQRLLDFFGIKGRYQPQLESYILPTIQVGDLSVAGPPPVSRHATAMFTVAAQAGEYWRFHLEANPGVICVITDIYLIPDTASYVNAGFSGGSILGTTATFKAFTDGRITGDVSFPENIPAGVAGSDHVASTVTPARWKTRLAANVENHIRPKGWVVGTGKPTGIGRFNLGGATVNVAVQGTVEWDEYQIF